MTSGGRSRLSPTGIQDGFLPSCCRKMLKLCGETEDRLAQELIHFELQVERDVIEPLFLLAEVRSGGAAVSSPGLLLPLRRLRGTGFYLVFTGDGYCPPAWTGAL